MPEFYDRIRLQPAETFTSSVPPHMQIVRRGVLKEADFTKPQSHPSRRTDLPFSLPQFLQSSYPASEHGAAIDFLRSFGSRSTTKATDEALILAIAMGCSTGNIVSSEGVEGRLRALYLAMGCVPKAWLYLGLPPLTTKNFTSVPRTLLLQHSLLGVDVAFVHLGFCEVSEMGLLGYFDAVSVRQLFATYS